MSWRFYKITKERTCTKPLPCFEQSLRYFLDRSTYRSITPSQLALTATRLLDVPVPCKLKLMKT